MRYIVIILSIVLLLTACAPVHEPTLPEEGEEAVVDMLFGEGAYEVTTGEVNYFEDITGYLAKPGEEGGFAGIIMIHEWWGLNDNVKMMAQQLASEGYVVLAVDLFKGSVATTGNKAREQTGALVQEEAIANMNAAISYLKEKEGVLSLGSMGWCFGGGQSLQLALHSEELDATVIYYGRLTDDKDALSNIMWPVLGVFGSADTSIPVSSVNAFDSALDGLGIENEIYVYDGVGHAFANPSGANHAPDETKDAWMKTVEFLNKHLKEN